MTSHSPNHPPLRFQVENLETLKADAAWWKIYEASFPKCESEPPEVIFRCIETGLGRAICAKEGDRTVGMSYIHLLQDPPAVFLGVMAVAREEQGHHIGGTLFEYAWEVGAAALHESGKQPLGYVWEVEIPSLGRTDAERRERERRIAFYQHHGASILPHPYLLPPLDGKTVQPMELMFRTFAGEQLPSVEKTEAIIRAMYFEKYGAVNGIEEEVLEKLLQAT